MLFELLQPHHDRQSFVCAREPLLTQYLQQRARQDQAKGLCNVHVLVNEAARETIIGFYTLSMSQLDLTTQAPDVQKLYGSRRTAPVALLGRMAVDDRLAPPGTGIVLLTDAIEKAFVNPVGCIGMVVDAKNAQLVNYYRRYGFVGGLDNPLQLFLPRGRFMS